MAQYYSPYPTVSDLRRPELAATTPIIEQWGAWHRKIHRALKNIPEPGRPIRPGELSQALYSLHTSEGELRQALSACAASQGIAVGSAGQLRCWLDAAARHVGEMERLELSIRELLAANERALLPRGSNGLRTQQLAFIAAQKRFLGALHRALTDPNTGWSVLLGNARTTAASAQRLDDDIRSSSGSMSGDPEFEALRRASADLNLEILRKVMLPYVDLSLAQLKTVRHAEAIARQVLGRQAELVQLLPEYKVTLEDYLDELRSHDDGGIFAAIMEGLFGKDPGKKVLKFMLGIGAVAVLTAGSIAIVRRAVRSN